VPSTLWTLYNEATTILNTWDFESPKTELKWVRYDQNKNSKNKDSKTVQQSGFIAKLPQTGTPNHYPSSPTRCPRKISQLCLLNRPNRLRDERVKRVRSFGIVAENLHYIADFLQFFQQLNTPTGYSDLVRNPMHAISTAQSKFPSEVISIKSGYHFQRQF